MDAGFVAKCFKRNWKKTITEVWPDAEVYFHGGVSFKPYRELYKGLFTKKDFRFMKSIMRQKVFLEFKIVIILMNYYYVDYGIFYEFIPIKGDKEMIRNYPTF